MIYSGWQDLFPFLNITKLYDKFLPSRHVISRVSISQINNQQFRNNCTWFTVYCLELLLRGGLILVSIKHIARQIFLDHLQKQLNNHIAKDIIIHKENVRSSDTLLYTPYLPRLVWVMHKVLKEYQYVDDILRIFLWFAPENKINLYWELTYVDNCLG